MQPITEQELAARVAAVRARLAERRLELALISVPENVYYLTGLDHWGYFAPHVLILPLEGEAVLVTRAMERVTILNQVRNARFEGHTDGESAAELAARLLRDAPVEVRPGGAQALAEAVEELAPRRRRIGVEKSSSAMPWRFAEVLGEAVPDAEWIDISDLIDSLRLVKSPAEQERLRAAARVSDAALEAALAAIEVGVPESLIAAECQRAMIANGGSYPGFGPFIRSSSRLGEEHTTWRDDILRRGDAVFLELSGCVARYHAPLGRLVYLGEPPEGTAAMAELSTRAFDAVVAALRPGVKASEVYGAWQAVVDEAGLSHYRRHHCGYQVGIGFPPSWTGGNKVVGLRHDSAMEIKAGMSFHILSWLMGTGRSGDWFCSDTVLLTDWGPEVLTRAPRPLSLG